MKNHAHDSMFAFALVAIAVPAVLIGVLTVSAASELSGSKATSYQLFELRSFRLQQRMIHQDSVPVVTSKKESHPAATVPPCATSEESSVEAETEKSDRALIFEDLNMLQREVLRKQLRTGGCPQDAMLGYKVLCESILKKQKSPSIKTGLKHPEQ